MEEVEEVAIRFEEEEVGNSLEEVAASLEEEHKNEVLLNMKIVVA